MGREASGGFQAGAVATSERESQPAREGAPISTCTFEYTSAGASGCGPVAVALSTGGSIRGRPQSGRLSAARPSAGRVSPAVPARSPKAGPAADESPLPAAPKQSEQSEAPPTLGPQLPGARGEAAEI